MTLYSKIVELWTALKDCPCPDDPVHCSEHPDYADCDVCDGSICKDECKTYPCAYGNCTTCDGNYECLQHMLDNDKCDPVCNIEKCKWDYGACDEPVCKTDDPVIIIDMTKDCERS